ncbi:transcriptional regulator, AraC family [Pseudomonas syringae]|nr:MULTISPECIES: AraC family transcriptional regulator [Pseudomonas]MCD7037242.1 AraC family transcriptional regulator [Pseudomonas petroselini]MCD7044145.1 AraC family transcriptional regulator [Pseudomonas petroselini]MCD7067374.1 AraC family transcriptional regulator [Pseudomonas petroselini]MCD7079448.1 AraC family transcriptional regulator [Pseudomonas petroselini]MCM2380545.1 AraC family transcriptional regulator [Pseudomonas marginalis]
MVITPSEARDRRWSTSDVENSAPLNAFKAVVSAEIAEMSVESSLPDTFRASWTRYGLGPIDLNFLECDSQKTSRSIEMANRDQRPFFELLYARKGRIQVSHCGEISEVPAGAFVLLSDQKPYSLDFPDGSICLTAHMPEDWLRKWVPDPNALVGKPLGVGGTWSLPLQGLLTAFADAGLETAPLPRFVLADQFGAMCALVANVKTPEKHNSELATRIRRFILEYYPNPTLSPITIAASLGISTRHLHRVLAGYNETYSGLLLQTRLNKAAQLLATPSQAIVSISDIAWAVGFVDQSHFARLFKSAFNTTPSQYRTSLRQG